MSLPAYRDCGIAAATQADVLYIFRTLIRPYDAPVTPSLLHADSVRQADIALCVVSIEELERRHKVARIPYESPVKNVWSTEMVPLLTPGTLVLLNKVDLAKESSITHTQVMQEVSSEVLARHDDGTEWWWPVSLTTGEGMQEFVQGLVGAIKQRYGRQRHSVPVYWRG